MLKQFTKIAYLVALLFAFNFTTNAQDETDTAAFELDEEALAELMAYVQQADSVNSLFTYDTVGQVTLRNGIATIDIPEGFKYLDAEQTKTVVEEIWGNPAQGPYLGMLFPSEFGPADYDGWAINISYSEDGYVEDDDAADIDYAELLEDMKEQIREANAARIAQGYPKIELVGWAATPYYDAETHKLHWAKELKFGEEEAENTLNYNIRVLGRKGYLELNAIAVVGQLEEVQQNIDGVLASVNFNDGYKYSDFDSSLDEVAAYGVGGLVAGKVLAKAGFFAMLAKFWKVIALGVAGAFGVAKKFFFGSKEDA